ncbi:MAG: hypothetical protein BVN35_12525 [Proteobacteria bacterium ST_bin11]|nr:MAG: hypothetical protein BVN35_12525 [Proteobacteria bacterium ST_bin11]
MQESSKASPAKPGADSSSAPGFLRRLAAACYDAFLLLAVWFFATAIALPFNAGQAFASDQFFFPLYLLIISFVFYGWFWTHGGQTLGLRAWKIKVCTPDGHCPDWRQAGVRFIGALLSWACLGLGFFWCLVDKNGQCWHDYLSKTRLVFQEEKR